jgi:hypothetical protein
MQQACATLKYSVLGGAYIHQFNNLKIKFYNCNANIYLNHKTETQLHKVSLLVFLQFGSDNG